MSKRAIIFWEACGHWFVETPHAGKQPVGPYDELDDAITAAKTAGFKIHSVQGTRGQLPAPGPQKPKEVLSGNRIA